MNNTFIFAGLIGFTLLLSSCNQKSPKNTNNDMDNMAVQVTDFAGNTVLLKQPAKKIVALAPHIVENVYSAGAGDNLTGVVKFSNYPAQALTLPIVGGYETTNHEKIVELDPDLIIAWESGNSRASVDRLMELGYTVYLDQPDKLSDIAKSIRDIGVLTGNQQQAETVASNYLLTLKQTKKLYKDKKKIPAFYQVWNQPLRTISGNHIISDAIETCGGINIYADEMAIAPVINIESVLERNPQVIIASGMSSARPDWLDEWSNWPSLKAVKQNNLFFVNPDHLQRHTVRLLMGIDSVCQQLDEAREKEQLK